MGISELGGAARTSAPRRRRVRAWHVVAGCIAGVLAIQTLALLAVPDGWRMAASSLLALIVFAGWFVISIRLARRRWSVSAAAFPAAIDVKGEQSGEQEPSERMRLACELARLGAPAVWIAAQCELPVALAELIITDVRGNAPRRDPSAG